MCDFKSLCVKKEWEQLRYDEQSYEYREIEKELNNMHRSATLTYVEEDGFQIHRGDNVYMIYGTCEGTYTFTYERGRMYMPNGDPGYPDEYDVENEDFDCWVDEIHDEDDFPVDIELTDDEFNAFSTYMAERLDTVADEYDGWED